MTFGVASPCRKKNPALVRKTIDTRNSRASCLLRDASLISAPSTTLSPATRMIIQKWLELCSHMMFSCGWASSSQSPSRGSTRWMAQTTPRTGCVAGGRYGLGVDKVILRLRRAWHANALIIHRLPRLPMRLFTDREIPDYVK